MNTEEHLKRMRRDWDQRARENARYYIATARSDWDDGEFYRSGENTIRDYIQGDLINICQGRDPGEMKVLEIGCGAGRVTCALARFFGEVHPVDISGEMIALAKAATAPFKNAHVHRNSGRDLDVLPKGPFDFAFSQIVFQHIPSREVIESYASDVAGRLRAGALFKLQLQGCEIPKALLDTWQGVGYSESQARKLAKQTGFDLRYSAGAGTQDFWLWLFRK